MQRSMESRNLSHSEELCITTPASLDPEQMEGERKERLGTREPTVKYPLLEMVRKMRPKQCDMLMQNERNFIEFYP